MVAGMTTKRLHGARTGALPNFIAPQLATLVKDPPPGDEWLHELKVDGYRMFIACDVCVQRCVNYKLMMHAWCVTLPALLLM